ncbi:hypothetical protein [Candidatus Neoehrlichia procyonis]|uniref:Uncharacterized protein n=1 Tax=Candidatus Neoehrlichia procyonis str. RAC413 TaxID=1359163 RepID=A0A0F3NPE4_9RICK|nr:hypothetical protein [Candidatus Neoehrlichia lotoris]KJV68784.1 hypothetical protein NLO413_0148 [Candidatus Neoehrlichia lotoris str. RAC413]
MKFLKRSIIKSTAIATISGIVCAAATIFLYYKMFNYLSSNVIQNAFVISSIIFVIAFMLAFLFDCVGVEDNLNMKIENYQLSDINVDNFSIKDLVRSNDFDGEDKESYITTTNTYDFVFYSR